MPVKHFRLHALAQGVREDDVLLLYRAGFRAAGDDAIIGEAARLAAVAPAEHETDHSHLAAARKRLQDVGRFAGCRDTEENIVGAQLPGDLPREISSYP